MNNDYLVPRFNPEQELPRQPFLEKRIGDLKELLEALHALNVSGVWKGAVEKVFISRLDNLTRRMRQESEPIQLYRLQGKINELENFIRLDKWIEQYENEMRNLKGQINKNDGKKD